MRVPDSAAGGSQPQTAALEGVDVVILAGGLGTRLQPVINDRPKPMAEVCGHPFLAHLLQQVAGFGARSVLLCVAHRAGQVIAHFGSEYPTAQGALRLRYVHEEQPLGTGGALRHAVAWLEQETVLVLNGDSYCEADLAAFRHWHQSRPAAISLVLTPVADSSRYGQVRVAADGKVEGFTEKAAGAGPGWINAGLYLTSRTVLTTIPADGPVSLERSVFPQHVGHDLYGWCGGGRFIDIGTPESYEAAAAFFAAPAG